MRKHCGCAAHGQQVFWLSTAEKLTLRVAAVLAAGAAPGDVGRLPRVVEEFGGGGSLEGSGPKGCSGW